MGMTTVLSATNTATNAATTLTTRATGSGGQSNHSAENTLYNNDNQLINSDFTGVFSSEVSTGANQQLETELVNSGQTAEHTRQLLAALAGMVAQIQSLVSSGDTSVRPDGRQAGLGSALPQVGNSLPDILASIRSRIGAIKGAFTGITSARLMEQTVSSVDTELLTSVDPTVSGLSHGGSLSNGSAETNNAIVAIIDSVSSLISDIESLFGDSVPEGLRFVDPFVDPSPVLSLNAGSEPPTVNIAGSPAAHGVLGLNSMTSADASLGENGVPDTVGREALSRDMLTAILEDQLPAPLKRDIDGADNIRLVRYQLHSALSELNSELKEVLAKFGAGSAADSRLAEAISSQTNPQKSQLSSLALNSEIASQANRAISLDTAVPGDLIPVPETKNADDLSESWQPARSWLQSLLAGSSPRTTQQTHIFRANLDLPVVSEPWGQQLGQRLSWMIGQGLSAAELMLNPAELGPLKVRVEQAEQSTRIAFVVQHAATREILETQLPRLRDMFAEQGLDLVDVESHDMSQFAQSQTDTAAQQGDSDGAAHTGSVASMESVLSVDGLPDEGNAPQVIVAQLRLIDTFA